MLTFDNLKVSPTRVSVGRRALQQTIGSQIGGMHTIQSMGNIGNRTAYSPSPVQDAWIKNREKAYNTISLTHVKMAPTQKSYGQVHYVKK